MTLSLAFLAFLALPSSASADGLYSEADLGARMFSGRMADVASAGPAFAVQVGWGPVSWFQVGGFASGSSHTATLPPPPSGQMFQIYQTGAIVRLGFRIHRVGIFIEDVSGIAFLSTNVLDSVGVSEPDRHWSPFIMAGGGLEYHLDNPRFALGIGGDYALYTSFTDAASIDVRFYVRYSH